MNKPVSFGSLAVTNPVRLTNGADGEPIGKLGVTIRTKGVAGSGGPLRVHVDLMGIDGGRYGGGEFITDGCVRMSIPLDELSTAAPLYLRRNQLFLLRVGVGYTEAPIPTGINAILATFTGWQFTGFLTQ